MATIFTSVDHDADHIIASTHIKLHSGEDKGYIITCTMCSITDTDAQQQDLAMTLAWALRLRGKFKRTKSATGFKWEQEDNSEPEVFFVINV